MDAERTGHVRKEAEPNDPATRQGCQGLPAAARGPERRGGPGLRREHGPAHTWSQASDSGL